MFSIKLSVGGVAVCAFLAGCAGLSSPSYPTNQKILPMQSKTRQVTSSVPPAGTPVVYVSDAEFGVVYIYSQVGRNQQPIGMITLNQSPADNEGVAVDAKGDLYVVHLYGSVGVYRQGQSTPYKTLIGGPNGMWGIALDAKGDVFVTSIQTMTITVWAAGHKTPTSALSIGFGGNYVAVDAAGDVFVSQFEGTQIAEFPSGSTTPVVLRTDQVSPWGLALDGSQNLIVAEQKYLNVYAPPYTGTAIRTVQLKGKFRAIALNRTDSSLWYGYLSQHVATRLTYPRFRDVESTWNGMSNRMYGIALYPAAPL